MARSTERHSEQPSTDPSGFKDTRIISRYSTHLFRFETSRRFQLGKRRSVSQRFRVYQYIPHFLSTFSGSAGMGDVWIFQVIVIYIMIRHGFGFGHLVRYDDIDRPLS